MLYEIRQGSLTLGGRKILDHVDFFIKGKERAALVGRNGAGKSSLLKLIAGHLALDRDDRHPAAGIRTARKTSIGMLSQSVFSPEEGEKTVEELAAGYCPDPDPLSRASQDFYLEFRRMFTGLGFALKDQEKKIKQFSGGQQTRIALIGLLLSKPDLLLLDEPLNHLDADAAIWLEDYLAGYPHALLLVSHDRYFIDQTVQTVWELSGGRLTRYPGNYTDYRRKKRKEIALQKKKYQAWQQEVSRLTALIEKYKHKPRKAAMARSKRKYLERMEKVEKPPEEEAHFFTDEIRPRERGVKRVLETDKLLIGWDHPIQEISFSLGRGQKIGIIGPNGSGKTTFLKTIAGQLPPLGGSLKLGQGIHIGYFDQMTAQIQSEERVFEHFSKQFPELMIKDGKKILGQYLFRGEDTRKRIRDLSGGEKSRLMLAELLCAGPNLLMLDEPDNHMDIPSRETMESAFAAYKGSMLFISHDRYFIKQVASSLLIFSEDGVSYYPFGYDHYQEHLRKLAAGEAGSPGAVEAENTRIRQELKAVPERKRMQSSRMNTDQSYTDWQLNLITEDLGQCKKRIEALLTERDKILSGGRWWTEQTLDQTAYENEMDHGRQARLEADYEKERDHGRQARLEADYEKEMEHYQQICLEWYDRYLAYQEAFASYRG